MSRARKVQQLDTDIPARVDGRADKINIQQAIKLRLVNKLSYQEIADIYGCTKQAVHRRITSILGFLGGPEEIKPYQDNRSEILTAVESNLLANIIDPAKLAKATVNNIAYAFQQVFNARRLEEGKSTANLHGIYGLLLQIDREERKGNDTIPDDNDNVPQDAICEAIDV